jgi:hypothetical protein
MELIERAWNAIDKFLKLESDEAAYGAAVAQGELKPELLFPDNLEEAGRVAAHPAILWKLQNVKNYLARPAGQKRNANPTKRHK